MYTITFSNYLDINRILVTHSCLYLPYKIALNRFSPIKKVFSIKVNKILLIGRAKINLWKLKF